MVVQNTDGAGGMDRDQFSLQQCREGHAPRSGGELQKLMGRTYRSPPQVIAAAAEQLVTCSLLTDCH